LTFVRAAIAFSLMLPGRAPKIPKHNQFHRLPLSSTAGRTSFKETIE
jgi:hypothetical protein